MLRPKTSELYNMDWCLSYGCYTSNPNGIRVVQDGYVNDSNHHDEWYILKSNKSFLQTTLYNESVITTPSFHNEVDLHYNRARVRGTLYSSINKSELVTQLHTNNYVCVITHGGTFVNKLKVTASDNIYLSDLSSLTSSDFAGVELIVLPCCYSGRSGGFVDYFLSRGVNVVIGFVGSIEQETTLFWTKHLLYYITKGNTVEYSIQQANYDLAAQYNSVDYEDVVSMLVNGIEYGTSAINTVIFSN